MSLQDLDPTLSSPKRLAALGMLSSTHKVDFAFMADHLQLSDSDLSKQMKALADAGYVKATKTGSGPKRRTWFKITKTGTKALEAHIAALNALVIAKLPPPTDAGSTSDQKNHEPTSLP